MSLRKETEVKSVGDGARLNRDKDPAPNLFLVFITNVCANLGIEGVLNLPQPCVKVKKKKKMKSLQI